MNPGSTFFISLFFSFIFYYFIFILNNVFQNVLFPTHGLRTTQAVPNQIKHNFNSRNLNLRVGTNATAENFGCFYFFPISNHPGNVVLDQIKLLPSSSLPKSAIYKRIYVISKRIFFFFWKRLQI